MQIKTGVGDGERVAGEAVETGGHRVSALRREPLGDHVLLQGLKVGENMIITYLMTKRT